MWTNTRTRRTTNTPTLHIISFFIIQKTICRNSTSNAPDDGSMYPKHVELRIHQYQVGISLYFTNPLHFFIVCAWREEPPLDRAVRAERDDIVEHLRLGSIISKTIIHKEQVLIMRFLILGYSCRKVHT